MVETVRIGDRWTAPLRHWVVLILPCLCLCTSLSAQEFSPLLLSSGIQLAEQTKGVAVADFDGDNYLDIFVVVQQSYDSLDAGTWSRLYRNNGNGNFSDVTIGANLSKGISGFEEKKGASWGDFNNDGWPDLLLSYAYGMQLFKNKGDGSFEDISDSLGISTAAPCSFYSGLWWDFNHDGLLDIFISTHNTCSGNNAYVNLGEGRFENVTDSLGLNISGLAYMSMPLDINQDGWTDLYTAVDYGENQLFVSDSGVSFSDKAAQYKLNSQGNDMGLTIGDYNRDGLLDLYCTDIRLNSLFRQNPDHSYSDLAGDYGIRDTDWAWETRFADFDHDADEDLFVVNGYKGVAFRNVLFKNLHSESGGGFGDVSELAGVGDEILSECFEVFDYDNDGDLDILVSTESGNENLYFYDNMLIGASIPPGGNWMKVSLTGTQSNRNGFGSSIELIYGNQHQVRYHHGAGLYSQSIQAVHFGLDTVSRIDTVLIRWPSRKTDTLLDIPTNRHLEVRENESYEFIEAPSNKKVGCMDVNSCSYDPEAGYDDGTSCVYLPGGQISGPSSTGMLSTGTYTYEGTGGNEFVWAVDNGTILEGQGTAEVEIQWGIDRDGLVSVFEVGECYGERVSMPIQISMDQVSPGISVARIWNEALLEAIRSDYARPTVHARNLFHTAVALYDAWAVYDEHAKPYLLGNRVGVFEDAFEGFVPNQKTEEARISSMSYAAYRLLTHRFASSPGASSSKERFSAIMEQLAYDTAFTSTDYSGGDPAALGNYIGQTIIAYGLQDGSREETGYDNAFYQALNPPLAPAEAGNANLLYPNRWQPLALKTFIDQSGHLIEGSTPEFLSPEWGHVLPFALGEEDKTVHGEYTVYHDPGAPPLLDDPDSGADYQWGFSLVSIWGSHLDPTDGVMWDVSPGSIGNLDSDRFPQSFSEFPSFYRFEGGDIGQGRELNPWTNEPYEVQVVPRGDYTRVLAEFWADGPDSETPPGHWFTLLNYVSDHPLLEKRFEGTGSTMDALEWDVKAYFSLAGAMHDAAISAWSIKGSYDYIRPISAIRYMAGLGQSSNPGLDNFHEDGIPLVEGYVEVVLEGDDLAGEEGEHVGKIKLYTWRGHEYIEDTDSDQAGVGWILAEHWWPYQRPSFVTPPFAGFVSGHSTYSRAAAEVMTLLTGDPYFPGGYGEFLARKNEFLVFEEGPSRDVKLRWATYRDASDQCSLSRIWGGIHPPADDIPGRKIGEKIGHQSFALAKVYFSGGMESDIVDKAYKRPVIYPNPLKAGQELRVANTVPEQVFELLDVQGRTHPLRIISSSGMHGTTVLDPGTAPRGIYILRSGGKAWKLVIE